MIRLQAMKREVHLRELQLLDAVRRRFMHHQQTLKEAELQRLDDEIERKVSEDTGRAVSWAETQFDAPKYTEWFSLNAMRFSKERVLGDYQKFAFLVFLYRQTQLVIQINWKNFLQSKIEQVF